MNETMFRTLKAEELKVKVEKYFKNGIRLSIYKDARVDMNVLDETFGPFNWERHFRMEGNVPICSLRIKNKDTGEWIEKEDASNFLQGYEAGKTMASDSFKRAATNFGIGRELYSAPLLMLFYKDEKGHPNFRVSLDSKGNEILKARDCNGENIPLPVVEDFFSVKKIEYVETDTRREISYIKIHAEKTGKDFEFGSQSGKIIRSVTNDEINSIEKETAELNAKFLAALTAANVKIDVLNKRVQKEGYGSIMSLPDERKEQMISKANEHFEKKLDELNNALIKQ